MSPANPCDPNGRRHAHHNMSTTIAVSEALKDTLESVQTTLNTSRDPEQDNLGLNEVVKRIVRGEVSQSLSISGPEQTLDERVWVSEYLRDELNRIKNEEDFSDYEAVIRNRAGLPRRDVGEEPVDTSSLSF